MTTTTISETSKPAVDAPQSRRRSLFPAVMASEWTKLRSVRSTIWSLLATLGMTIGFGVLFCFAFVSRYDRLELKDRLTFDPTAQSLRGLFLAQLAIGVLGVLIVSSEYATGLIRTTLATVPQRRVVLAAKAAVFGAVALTVSMIAVFIAFFAGQAALDTQHPHGKHLGVSITDPHVLRAVLGAGAFLTIIGLLGLGIATIVRRTAGGIATLFGIVLVLPALAQALPSPWNNDVAKYLPSGIGAGLGNALFSVRPDPNRLSPGIALLVGILWVVAIYLIATLFITRRDA
jgi:hypothetical protein